MTHSLAAIRTEVEARLGSQLSAAFAGDVRSPKPTIATGIGTIDRALGGVPRGAITELVALPFVSAGQKSLQTQLLARATQERACALVDGTDSFDPKSARAIGVDLRRLLWVRCSGQDMKGLEQAFKCADLLLQGSGGFGLILVDLASVSQRFVRKIPLTTWFRLRAVVERQDTALVFSTSSPVTSTCTELRLALSVKDVRWSQLTDTGPTHARVFAGFDFEADISRTRSFRKTAQSATRSLLAYPQLA